MPVAFLGPGSGRGPIGYAGLITHYRLPCPLPRQCLALGPGTQKVLEPDIATEWMVLPRGSAVRAPRTPIEHLGIALKHEGVDLRILASLFAAGIGDEVAAFVQAHPRGQYTRRAWYLYEWLTGEHLPIDLPDKVQYVPVLDPAAYFTRSPVRSPRHKVDNNLPGVPGFCPLVRRTERLSNQRLLQLGLDTSQILAEAEPALLRRATAHMLLNESKGSFGIEGEAPPQTRLGRWGHVIAIAGSVQLSIPELEALQRSLFDKAQRFVRTGLRQVGGFVGRHASYDIVPLPDHV